MALIKLRCPPNTTKVFLGDGSFVVADLNGIIVVDAALGAPLVGGGGFSTALAGSPSSRSFVGSGSQVAPQGGDQFFNTHTAKETVFNPSSNLWVNAADGTLDPLNGAIKADYPAQSGLDTTVFG